MWIGAPFGLKIKTERGFYLYDVNTNNIARVDKDIFNNSGKTFSFSDSVSGGLFHRIIPFQIVMPFGRKTVVDELSAGLLRLTLFIADTCNMRCSYCCYSDTYEGNRHLDENRVKIMKWDVAKKAVDFYFSHSTSSRRKIKEHSVGFYGGEPLLNYELIVDVIEYIEKKYNKFSPVIYTISTNLTPLTPQMVDFFIKHRVHISVSLDGPKELHDRYRVFRNGGGSFDVVIEKLKMIKEKDNEYFKNHIVFNVVLAPPIDLMKVYRFFNDKFPDSGFANIGGLTYSGNPRFEEVYKVNLMDGKETEEDTYKIYKETVIKGERPDRFLSRYYDEKFWYIHNRRMSKLPEVIPETNSCIPGQVRLMIDPEGKFYPCEKGASTVQIGDIDNGFYYDKIFNMKEKYTELRDNICKGCWAIRFCNSCIIGAITDGQVDKEEKLKECERIRKFWGLFMERYIEIMEKNIHAFDYLRKWVKKEQYFLL